MRLGLSYILIATVLFNCPVQVKPRNCWSYSDKFNNDVKPISTTQIGEEGATPAILEEVCRDFCLRNEDCQAVLLDLRSWSCSGYGEKGHKRVRGHEEVALAFRRCLKVQNGKFETFDKSFDHLFNFKLLYHPVYRYGGSPPS